MPEYALVLLLLFLVSFALHQAYKIKLYVNWQHFLSLNLVVIIVACLWDNFAIWRGHWTFNPEFLLGPKIGLMPIEEFGFILACEYFGLVLYKILEKRFKSFS